MNEAIPQDLSRSDVWQWLGRGWFYLKRDDGSTIPAQLEEGCEGEGYLVAAIDGFDIGFDRSKCYPHWPQCGAINMQGFAIVVDRQQIRQYRRTYNSRCVLIDIPRKWDAMKNHDLVRHITPDSVEVVKAVFDPVYYTYTRALTMLRSGWVSVALNPYLIVAGTTEEQMIYYRSKLTAHIIEGRLVPLDPGNSRNRRILKWFDGRVSSESL